MDNLRPNKVSYHSLLKSSVFFGREGIAETLWRLCKRRNDAGEPYPVIAISLAQDAALRVHSPFLVCLFGSIQSELRVRHRDETKNVTRLTMENVSQIKCCLCFF